jgi:hypothetical protein
MGAEGVPIQRVGLRPNNKRKSAAFPKLQRGYLMTHECEWISLCCGTEPANELEGEKEGIMGFCAECREASSFSCEEHPLGEDYNGIHE